MVELRRTIRFCINPPGTAEATGSNGFGGVPAMRGLGRYYELEAACRGDPDPVTGYLINIKHIDDAIRAGVIPIIEQACELAPAGEPVSLLPAMLEAATAALRDRGVRPSCLRWRLTPTYSVEMSPTTPHMAVIRQQFDLAVAHRLHAPSLTDDANRQTFGKCNNPAGHGHNYRIEVAISVPVGGQPIVSLAWLEEVVGRTLVDRFDHTHLNVDTPEFRLPDGVNPSVENIAQVFFSLLAPEVARTSKAKAELRSLTVWETDRTCATYPASG